MTKNDFMILFTFVLLSIRYITHRETEILILMILEVIYFVSSFIVQKIQREKRKKGEVNIPMRPDEVTYNRHAGTSLSKGQVEEEADKEEPENSTIYFQKKQAKYGFVLCGSFIVAIVACLIRERFSMIEGILMFPFCLLINMPLAFKINQLENEVIRDGEVIWAEINHAMSQEQRWEILVYANYYWEGDDIYTYFIGYTKNCFGKKKKQYVEQILKQKYVPVFVDSKDKRRYVVMPCTYQFSEREYRNMSERQRKKIIRKIAPKEEG